MHRFFSESKAITVVKKSCFSFFFSMVFVFAGNTTEIIVNQSVASNNKSLNKTRAIFTMRQRFWPNGEKIKVFTLADNHPLHKNFTKNNLHMFPHQLRRVWDRMVFSGTGQAPIKLDSEDEMLKKIATTPNAIGYLSSEPENENIRLFIYQ